MPENGPAFVFRPLCAFEGLSCWRTAMHDADQHRFDEGPIQFPWLLFQEVWPLEFETPEDRFLRHDERRDFAPIPQAVGCGGLDL